MGFWWRVSALAALVAQGKGLGASVECYMRPDTWPPRKAVPSPGRDAPHVVLQSKYEEPWGTIARGMKEILVERGCTVYDPNVDDKEHDGWNIGLPQHSTTVLPHDTRHQAGLSCKDC